MSMVFRSDRTLRDQTMKCSQKEILRNLDPVLTHDNQEMDQDGKDFKRVTFKVRKVNLCIRLKGIELV